jgi:hypothetical protein
LSTPGYDWLRRANGISGEQYKLKNLDKIMNKNKKVLVYE